MSRAGYASAMTTLPEARDAAWAREILTVGSILGLALALRAMTGAL